MRTNTVHGDGACRYLAVRACKWVDQVVEDAPYVTQLDTLDQYNIDFVVHGDDITTNADGVDAYHIVKSAGRYRYVCAGVAVRQLRVGRRLIVERAPFGLRPLGAASASGQRACRRLTWSAACCCAPRTT